MRILIIHQFLWAHYKAGIFNSLNALCEKNGDQLLVLQTSLFEEARKDFGMPDRSLHRYPYKLLFEGIYEETGFWNRVKTCLTEIRSFKPDVVNIPGYYDMAMILVMIWARLRGIKIILSNDSTANDNSRNFFKEGFKRFLISFAQGYFCYGTASANYMLDLGARPEQILLRRNSVNNGLVKEKYEENLLIREQVKEAKRLPEHNFIYVGRFLEIKNLPRLISAFSSLRQADNWGLILMGEGPVRSEIESRSDTANIFFFPPGDWKDVAGNLALADVLILPSYSEPWGLVVNEAMVCGLPVIVSQQSGAAADIVQNGFNGFVFDAYEESQLREKMQFFIDNSDRIQEMGKASQEIIVNFSPEKVSEEMYEGFRKLAERS